MQPEKKQLEILIMDYFRESYHGFPNGKIVATESPDFTVKLKSHNILGIELTRLNPENALPLDELALQKIATWEHLIETVKEIFERNSKLKLFVKFLFSEDKTISPERAMSVAVRSANLIRNTTKNKKTSAFFKVSILENQLPEGIFEILIINHPGMETSIWERSNNLGISNNVLDDIHKAIHKKDEKLRLYHKNHLNYYWLLISTDRLRGVKNLNLPNKILNHKFESSFQHVFLFDLIKSKVYEIV